MAPYALAIALLLAIYIAWPALFARRPVLISFMPVLALGIMLAQLVIQSLQVAMIPLYGYTVAVVFLSAWVLLRGSRVRGADRTAALPGVVFALLILAVVTVIPILILPG